MLLTREKKRGAAEKFHLSQMRRAGSGWGLSMMRHAAFRSGFQGTIVRTPRFRRGTNRSTEMTAHLRNPRETGRQLRTLEESIAVQRRVIIDLEANNLDATSERERLTLLLESLDQILRYAANGASPVSDEESLVHGMRQRPF